MPLPALPPLEAAGSAIPDVVQDWLVRGADPDIVLGQKDSLGALWYWDDIDGWFETSPMDTAISGLGNSDRSFGATRFPRKERYLTITGVCQVETISELWAARTRLVDAWDRPNEPFSLIVEEPIPKRVTVRSVGPIKAPWSNLQYSFEFSIPLVALDPAKYSLTPITGQTAPASPGIVGREYPYTYPYEYTALSGSGQGLISMYNEGNNNTYPVMTITGPIDAGWSIVNDTTGKVFSVNISLLVGQSLILDFAKQTATVNNQSVQFSVQGEWFPLVKGNNQLRFLAPSFNPSTNLAVSAYSSWK